MGSALQSTLTSRRGPENALTPLHCLVVLSLAVGTVIGGAGLILGGRGLQLPAYLAVLGFYGAASTAFVLSRIRRGRLQLLEIPVFMTVMFFVQFGLFPLRNFIDPEQIDRNLSPNGQELVRALFYFTLGMLVFWLGCELARDKGRQPVSRDRSIDDHLRKMRAVGVLPLIIVLYGATLVTRFYLLKNSLYGYLTIEDEYFANLASTQVFNAISQLGTVALIVVAIEWYRARRDPLWRAMFILVFCSELVWGLISGSKGMFLQNFIVLALVSSFVQRKLNLRWLVVPFFVLVLFYPVSNAYRDIVRNSPQQEVTSLGGAAEAARLAFIKARSAGPYGGYSWRDGLNNTLQRMELLTPVAQVLVLGPQEGDMVKGGAQWWMLPIYPFIPRFLWRSKPILDEGGRFTLALQGRFGDPAKAGSSTAITYPGDLYLRFGLPGILLGMFVLGVVAQWFTNRVAGSVEPRTLLLYAAIYLSGFPFEVDAFSLWAGLAKLLVTLYILRWVIYGGEGGHRSLLLSPPVGLGRL